MYLTATYFDYLDDLDFQWHHEGKDWNDYLLCQTLVSEQLSLRQDNSFNVLCIGYSDDHLFAGLCLGSFLGRKGIRKSQTIGASCHHAWVELGNQKILCSSWIASVKFRHVMLYHRSNSLKALLQGARWANFSPSHFWSPLLRSICLIVNSSALRLGSTFSLSYSVQMLIACRLWSKAHELPR